MEKITNYKCPSCASPLMYNIEFRCWKCECCGNEFDVKLEYSVEKKQLNLTKNKNFDLERYECPSCGAKIITNDNTISTFCVYCGNSAVINQQTKDDFSPDGIITFKITEKDAKSKIKNMIKRKILAPNNIIKNIKCHGMYVPFWLFDCEVVGSILGGKINYEGRKEEESYLYKEKSYYIGDAAFSKVPVDAGSKFEDSIFDEIGPFDYSEIKEFTPSYLSGFFAEKYDLKPNEVFDRAEEKIKDIFENAMIRKMNEGFIYSENEAEIFLNVNNIYYLLAPVWFIEFEYKHKKYKYTMNGQTGKIVERFPISWSKVCFLFIWLFMMFVMGMSAVFYDSFGPYFIVALSLIITILTLLILIYNHNILDNEDSIESCMTKMNYDKRLR